MAKNNRFELTNEISVINQDFNNNTSTVRIKLKLFVGSSFEHRSNMSIVVDNQNVLMQNNVNVVGSRDNTITLLDTTTTIQHDSEGKKQITVVGAFETIQKASYTPGAKMIETTVYTLPTIPRKSAILTHTNTINTSTPTINATCDIKSNVYSVQWDLHYTHNGTYHHIKTIVGTTNYQYTIERHLLDTLVSKIKDSNTYTIQLTLFTKNKNTNKFIGSVSKNIVVTFGSEYAPTISNVAVTEINNTVKSMYLGSNKFLKDKSLPQANATYTLKHGATLDNVEFAISSFRQKGNPKILPTIYNEGAYIVECNVTDSRGLKATKNTTIEILDYKPPTINSFKVERNDNGKGIKAVVSANTTVTSLMNKNTHSISIEYREIGTETWYNGYSNSNTYLQQWNMNNYMILGTFDKEKAYELKLTVTDRFNHYSNIIPLAVANKSLILMPKGFACGGEPKPSLWFKKAFVLIGDFIDEYGNNYLLKAYPIGAIYINVDNRNPETFLGGKWRHIGQGRTLVGLDDTQSEFTPLRKIGGTKTHTLTINEMPSHNHRLSKNQAHNGGAEFSQHSAIAQPLNKSHKGWWTETTFTGGGQPHNNLQPYIVVTIWERYE